MRDDVTGRARPACRGLVAAVVAAGTLSGVTPAAPAAADSSPVPGVVEASPIVFDFTGGTQTWTVPAGVDSVAYVVEGAGGGAGRGAINAAPVAGGGGAKVVGGLQVTAGETLTIMVGGAGAPGSATAGGAGGFGGGGAGGSQGGGGGGGASAIRRGATALVVAAGGGGAGGGGDVKYGGNGGAGGVEGSNGQPGSECPNQNVSGEGGLKATTTGAGAGGAGALPGTLFAASPGGTGGALQGGTGGNAWNSNGAGVQAGGGGGGGGGVFGGGGGGGGTLITSGAGCGSVGAGGGGGGGSSLVPLGDAGQSGVHVGNGRVTIIPGPWAPLFISEYVVYGVGTSSTIAVEIYNPTSSPVTLTDRYRLGNGDGWALPLYGTVASGGVFVVAVGALPNVDLLVRVNQVAQALLFGVLPITLRGGSTLLDEVNVGASADGLCTATHRRRPSINAGFTGGKPFVCSDEYDAFPKDTIDGLGSHWPPLSIADATVTESTGTDTTLHLPVTLARPSPLPVTVDYATAAGTATAPADFTATTGTLSFAPGETVKTVDVSISGDYLHEATEQLTVALSNPVNAVIADGMAEGTILDDDPLPVVNATADSASTGASMAVDIDVLANDTVSVGGLSAPEVVSGPAHGSATVLTGTVRYTPAAGFSGADQLDYRVCSTWTPTACAVTTVAVSVAPAIVGIVPQRIMDTRPDTSTIDGSFAGIGQRAAGSTTELPVAGRAGVPANAPAVVLNVTATQVAAQGFVTVWPCGSPRPLTSNLNMVAGQTVPNAVITKIGQDGKVCLYTQSATQLIVDVNAYFPAPSAYQPAVPARLMDTRPGKPTIDGSFAGIGQRAAGSTTELVVTGRGPVPGEASAVVLNVTATNVTGTGYVTVWPCGSPRPLASNLNVVAGQTVPNLVIAKVGTGGKVCLYTLSALDLLADVDGYFPVASSYQPSVPQRIMDTRLGGWTVDGSFEGIGQRAAGSTTELLVAGRAGVPADAPTVVLNVTATQVAAQGFVTVWPCGSPRPLASNLNVVAGQTVANAVIAKVGQDGKVCLYTQSATQLIVDVNGYFT